MAGQIFNGNINAQATAWMMIYMLAFAVMWEAFCGWIEKHTEENKANAEMVSKVGRELIILGFIAFAVILMKEVDVLHWNSETLHVFEFCDLLVSICVLIYVANCAFSSLTMGFTQRGWDRIAMTQTSVIMNDVTGYMQGMHASGWKKLKHRLPLMDSWREQADFKVLQLLFEANFHLPPHFDYVAYIKLVLQGVVVSMANIEMWHWVMIMAINFVWWIAIKYWMPLFDMEPTSDDHICLFETVCTEHAGQGVHRRLASAATAPTEECRAKLFGSSCKLTLLGDNCTHNTAGLDYAVTRLNTTASGYWESCEAAAAKAPDITANDTKTFLWWFVAIGWLTLLFQVLIVMNIRSRMKRMLAFNGALHDDRIVELLATLQKAIVKEHAGDHAQESLGQGEAKTTHTTTVAQSASARHLIILDGDKEGEEDGHADHIMEFKETSGGNGKNSNDVLSMRDYERLVFASQFLQLVIDFYLGFYLVHMRHRVPLAFGRTSMGGGNTVSQLIFHLAILTPVVLMMYVLMIMARNIALLVGVLHLNQNALTEVLQDMEIVKSIRRRIQDTLAKANIMNGTPDPQTAHQLLQKAEQGEVAILKTLGARAQGDRIERKEMKGMVAAHAVFLTLTADDLASFLDRGAFASYKLEDPAHQATAQTSMTLLINPQADDGSYDSIEVREFSTFVVRYLADITENCMSMHADPAVVEKFRYAVADLPATDTDMIMVGRRLSRTKALFFATDTDRSGVVSRNELFRALRRFKVPCTKKEYRQFFRVIDPDQNHNLKLDEWVDFMSASELGLDLHTKRANTKGQLKNSQRKSWLSRSMPSLTRPSATIHPIEEGDAGSNEGSGKANEP